MKDNTENLLERNQAIKQAYLDGLAAKKDSDSLIEEIAKSNSIGKFYVRSILKDQNVTIERKEQYSRKDEKQLLSRNQQIMDRFDEGDDPEVIAEKFGLTVTRIRQLLKGKIVKTSKLPKLNHIKAEIESKVEDDVQYSEIVEEYGKSMIKQLRYNLDFNAFQVARLHMHINMVNLTKGKGIKSKKTIIGADVITCKNLDVANKVRSEIIKNTPLKKILVMVRKVDGRKSIKVEHTAFIAGRKHLVNDPLKFELQNKNGLTENKTAGDSVVFIHVLGPLKEFAPDVIANFYGVTRHYVYTLLHEHNIRFHLSKRDKDRRDKEIASAYRSKEKIEDIAAKHDLTPTMVRIILNGRKKKKAEQKLASV
jgi:Mor family transcriptional regulator